MTAARRAIAGTALAIGLPLATAGLAGAQSGPSGASTTTTTGPGGATATTSAGASGPSAPRSCATTTTTGSGVGGGSSSGGTGGSGLARTGGDAALPLAVSAAAITVVLGGRRFASRLNG
jgi:hypothetical protein